MVHGLCLVHGVIGRDGKRSIQQIIVDSGLRFWVLGITFKPPKDFVPSLADAQRRLIHTGHEALCMVDDLLDLCHIKRMPICHALPLSSIHIIHIGCCSISLAKRTLVPNDPSNSIRPGLRHDGEGSLRSQATCRLGEKSKLSKHKKTKDPKANALGPEGCQSCK